jgi:hypothetical protein
VNTVISGAVAFSSRRALLVLVVWAICAALSLAYTVTHFEMNTDSSKLLSEHLPWRQREAAFDRAFPHRAQLIAVVIDAETPDAASRAAAALSERLRTDRAVFEDVWRPDGGDFFERNGLLFLPPAQLQQTLDSLVTAQPLLGPLASDPTLRGLMNALALLARGAVQSQTPADEFARPFLALADTVEAARAGAVKPLAWRALITGASAEPRERRRIVLVHPVLDFDSLQPGERAAATIRDAARALGLTPDNGLRVRLTGQVRLADEEFATLKEGALSSAAVTLVLVALLLWLALRSAQIIGAILASLFMGLAVTAALGLAIVGSFNPISVAFAVLFLGLGVDFGIQLCVSYRARRHMHDDLHDALRAAGGQVGSPLALAAAATAIGFFAFLPTDYRGVAELGLIAGCGMLIAFASSVTLLPALLALLRPAREQWHVGIAELAPADAFLQRHSGRVVSACVLLAAASAALLPMLDFDFNPLNLRSSKVESMSTLLELVKDPDTTPNTLDVLVPDLKAADALARTLAALPEVRQALTLSSFIPDDQDAKLGAISDAALLLGPALQPSSVPAAADAENVDAMRSAARALVAFAAERSDPAAVQAKRLASAIQSLLDADAAARERAHAALMPGLVGMLAQLRTALSASPVGIEGLPREIVRDWIAADGRARVEIYPKGDSLDNRVLERFVAAVRAVAPEATGPPLTMQASGEAIVRAFIEAGVLAVIAITLLLAIVLRRVSDVLLTLAPLLLSGLVTLALCVVIGQPLNYANIIALPLLFGIGVAFNIYFVMAWRAGSRDLLASSLARAVIFSALTTASAFGSLWLSSHPGTASMGELLALSLVCTLACALVFLPALLAFTSRRR